MKQDELRRVKTAFKLWGVSGVYPTYLSNMLSGTTICSELICVAAWNDSMYRNRSIATLLANSSLLPEARVL